MSSPNGVKSNLDPPSLMSINIHLSNAINPFLKNKRELPHVDMMSHEELEAICNSFQEQGLSLNMAADLYFHLASVLAHAERVVAAKKQRDVLLGAQAS